MSDIAIKVEGVAKDFRLPHDKADTVKSIFTRPLRYITNTKFYGTQHALKDISFEIQKGEFFGIVGRNGSGKSTLLKILAGIYQPNKGTVYVDGRLVPFIELGVGFNGELTGRENVYLNGALLGFTKKEMDDQYHDIVEFAELSDFMDQKLKNYSSGMQVRLAFALAIRAETDILLVDEVLAVGDADFQRKCFDHFRKLKALKKTVVFVSHDMGSVREYCDRAILIENSQIIARGKADAIATKYVRMFFDKDVKKGERLSVNQKRWGDKAIRYTDINATLSDDKQLVTIELKAMANELIKYPNFGFTIRNSSGQAIMGTNSQIKRQKIAKLEKGQSIDITWSMANVFNDGTYSVEPAVVRENGEVCDWWEDASSFRIQKEERTPYLVNPDVTLEIRT